MSAILTPCPRCSSRYAVSRPVWNYARHTSEKRGVRCVIWTGMCGHASNFNKSAEPLSDEAEIAAVEARWTAHALSLFNETTALWTPAQRALHARTLGIELPPEPPAQPATTKQ